MNTADTQIVGLLTQIQTSGGGGGSSGITALTGDVTASGTGSVAATIAAASITDAKLALTTPALGTPSALVLTNATGLPVSGITASTSAALGVGTIELGAESDTTIARSGAGAVTVEGVQVLLSGAALGTPASGTVTNLTGTASININGTVGATTPDTGAFTTLTNTGAATNSAAGTASTPALKLSGVPFAGTGTTSFPLVYINDANATASSTLNTAGTYLGVNGDGTQDLMNLLKDGVSQFKVASDGSLSSSSGTITFFNTGIARSGRFLLQGFSADGTFAITNTAGTDFQQISFGPGGNNSYMGFARDTNAGGATTVAASVSNTFYTFNDKITAASGTLANRYVFGIGTAPTFTSTNASVTDTVASTFYIGGAPTASTNTTIGTAYALNVAAGNTLLAGALITTPQALSGAGAVNVTTSATAFTSTGAAQALTLADGAAGQIKTIAHVVDGGSGVLTPTTKSGYTTITFTNVGDSVTLQFFTTAGWCIVGIFGAVAA